MNTASKLLLTAVATASLPLVAGCVGAEEQRVDPIEPEVFVSAMAHLSQVHQFPPGGSASVDVETRADSLRAQILRDHGITAEELLAFAEQVGREPARMEELAQQIATINDSLTAERDPVEPLTDEETAPPASTPSRITPAEQAEKEQTIRSRLDSLRKELGRTGS